MNVIDKIDVILMVNGLLLSRNSQPKSDSLIQMGISSGTNRQRAYIDDAKKCKISK